MKLLSKTITRRFKNSRYLFFTACVFHPIDVPFLSSIRIYYVFKDAALKRHSRYNDFRRHCRLIKSPVCTREIYALPQPPQPNKIRAQDAMHKDTT